MKKETVQRTSQNAIILAVLTTIQIWLANRNDDNGRDRIDQLKKEQWQQRRADQDTIKAVVFEIRTDVKKLCIPK